IEHIVERDDGDVEPSAERRQMREPCRIVAGIEILHPEREAFAESLLEDTKVLLENRIVIGHGDGHLAFGISREIGALEEAFALLRAALAQSQQQREARISLAVGGIEQHARRIGEIDAYADD